MLSQDFAAGPSQMVGQPTEVSYAHLMPPQVGDSIVPGHLTVTVTEVWTYSGPSDTFTESFEFFYTLAHQDGQWRIISYTFLGTPQTHVEVGSASRYRPTPEETQR